MKEYVEEAIEWLRLYCGWSKHVLCCISGGKDSIVVARLCQLALAPDTWRLQSTLTGIDPPEVTQFIRKQYPTCSFVRPRLTFWHMILTKNPPGGTGRGIKWCCTEIKEKPSARSPEGVRVLGIRAEESAKRAKYGRVNQMRPYELQFYPIFDWKEWQVWEFIEEQKLPLPTLADESCIYDHLARVGCVICPNHSGTHHIYRKLWPKFFECFERYVGLWWQKRVGQGKEMWYGSPQEFLENWYAGRFYYYKPCADST